MYLPETLSLLQTYQHLMLQYGVQGSAAYDARLAAYVPENGLAGILTFNGQDFARYQIPVLHPDSV